MKILKDTMLARIETWDDPGDYPSNAGSGPLPSYKYIADIEGEVVLELTQEEAENFDVADWMRENSDFTDGVKWGHKTVVTIYAEEVNA